MGLKTQTVREFDNNEFMIDPFTNEELVDNDGNKVPNPDFGTSYEYEQTYYEPDEVVTPQPTKQELLQQINALLLLVQSME